MHTHRLCTCTLTIMTSHSIMDAYSHGTIGGSVSIFLLQMVRDTMYMVIRCLMKQKYYVHNHISLSFTWQEMRLKRDQCAAGNRNYTNDVIKNTRWDSVCFLPQACHTCAYTCVCTCSANTVVLTESGESSACIAGVSGTMGLGL